MKIAKNFADMGLDLGTLDYKVTDLDQFFEYCCRLGKDFLQESGKLEPYVFMVLDDQDWVAMWGLNSFWEKFGKSQTWNILHQAAKATQARAIVLVSDMWLKITQLPEERGGSQEEAVRKAKAYMVAHPSIADDPDRKEALFVVLQERGKAQRGRGMIYHREGDKIVFDEVRDLDSKTGAGILTRIDPW